MIAVNERARELGLTAGAAVREAAGRWAAAAVDATMSPRAAERLSVTALQPRLTMQLVRFVLL